jgi:predicted CxxxxCH...CXXCH cytochrome family protein
MHPRLPPRRLALLGLVGTLLVSGCEQSAAPRAARADRIGEGIASTCTSPDAHARHAAASVACVACHPCGGVFGFDAAVTYPGGTTSAGGTFTPGTGTSPPSCSVGCHSPLGSGPHSVSWQSGALACTACHDISAITTRKPNHPPIDAQMTREQCEYCHVMSAHTKGTIGIAGHDADWGDPTKPTFHAFTANQGLARCQGCHGQQLQGNGATIPSCVSCHNGGPGLTDAVAWSCVMCHGGTDGQTGAPPKAQWGQAGDASRGGGTADPVRVGAHTAHVTPSGISPGFGCNVCHVTPADALAAGHVDDKPAADVAFAGLAVSTKAPAPAWSRASGGTCSNVYCHGSTMTGSAPAWTAGAGAAFCGSCHGVPPPSPHPVVDVATEGMARCSVCHPATIAPDGTMIAPSAGGAHLNGNLEAMGHDANWMNTSSPEFHAFAVDRDIQGCTGCHGAQLEGGATGISCTSCHNGGTGPNDAVAWNCVMCHGGDANQTGAPPKALWGYAGDPNRGPAGNVADPLRVGAHTKHLATTLMSPIACESCHVVPADVLAPAHIDGSDALATVTFSGKALLGGITNAAWSRASGTCASTYCHGNYSGTYTFGVWDWSSEEVVTIYRPYAGRRATPGWTDAPVGCGGCHGNPPAASGYWHSGEHGSTTAHRQCQLCHPDAYSETGVGLRITNPTQHVNGIVEVTPRWTSGCMGCH